MEAIQQATGECTIQDTNSLTDFCAVLISVPPRGDPPQE